MPFKIDCLCDLDGFWEGKRKQVGIQIEDKSMLTSKDNFTLFFLGKNNDFEGSCDCKIDGKSIKNRWKNEAEDGMPLGIDLGWILVGLARQVGKEDRAKIE